MTPLFPEILEKIISVAAGIILFCASLYYMKDVGRRKVKPRIFSWMGWFILMAMSLTVSILKTGWQWNQAGVLVSTLSAFTVSLIALRTKNFIIKKIDFFILSLGVVSIVIYYLTNDAVLTISFNVLSDFIISIPTFHNVLKNPENEKTPAWTFGLIGWSLNLLLCIGYDSLNSIFPVYLFLFNLFMFSFCRRTPKFTKQ